MEGENDTEIIFLIYKLPTQGRHDFKPLNLWYCSEKQLLNNFYSPVTCVVYF